MASEINKPEKQHSVILEGRARLSVSGVEDVESFDEDNVLVMTTRGTLNIKGTGLRIDKLSLDHGELSLEGDVYSLQYEDNVRRGEGLWQRLFR